MAIVAGIDEAGYGPVLGPLMVTGTAFEVPDEHASSSLWQLLQASVTRRARPRNRRLPIADSKKLYSPALGLAVLERTAQVMFRTAQPRTPSFRELLQVVAPGTLQLLSAYPWYDGFDLPLPTVCGESDIATRTNAVRRDMEARGVRLLGVFCEPLLEGHFNQMISSTRNKADVSMGLIGRVIQRILSRAGGSTVHFHIDRQGGREYYTEPLLRSLGACHVQIVEESRERSAYELVQGSLHHTVDFIVGGEDLHLPIALASIYSKYLRELFMSAFNGWWRERVAGLRPTAGYYGDGWRFVREIGPTVARLGIDRSWLVRAR